MFENSIEILALAKIREDEMNRALENRMILRELKTWGKPAKWQYLFYGKLGRLFSSIGASLQSQYHIESEDDMRKVS